MVLAAAIFLAAVSWNQVIPFFPFFMKDLGVKERLVPMWMGWVYAAQSVAAIIAVPFWGKMGDHHGRKPMIIRAGVFLTLIYFGTSLCRTPLQLVVMRFLNGALTGFVPGSFALVATNTPEEHAPRAIATLQTANMAGLIVGPPLGGLLASLFGGYRFSMQVSGVAVLLTTLAVWWLVKEPNRTVLREKTSLLEDFLISLRSPVQLSVMWAIALAWSFGAAINPFLTIHLSHLSGALPLGVKPDVFAGAVFSLPAWAFAFSAYRWTRYGERRGYGYVILVGIFGSAASALALFFAPDKWSFAALYFVSGIWLAAISPSIGAITCTRIEESFRGRAYGIQQSAGTIGGMVMPLAAALIATSFGIRGIFLYVGVVFFAGAFLFRRLLSRWDAPADGSAFTVTAGDLACSRTHPEER
jgi:MFS family permease